MTGKQYDYYRPQLTCVLLVHITSTHKPGSDATIGERSNFKIFLRTRKIMVMHSNERGECCPRTLIDRKRKRYDNAVDVVVRLHDPTDPSTKSMAPPRSAHVRLGDVPRTLDPAECRGRASSA